MGKAVINNYQKGRLQLNHINTYIKCKLSEHINKNKKKVRVD